MYGAILGDMIGAPYEFDRSPKTKDFPLFGKKSKFTDDSVMTVAVAEALLDTLGQEEKVVKLAALGPSLSTCWLWPSFQKMAPGGQPESLRQLWQWFCHACGGSRLALRQPGGDAACGAVDS